MIDFRVLLGAVALFLGAFFAMSLLSKSTLLATAAKPTAPLSSDESQIARDLPQIAPPTATSREATPAGPEMAPVHAALVRHAPPEMAALSEQDLLRGRDRIRVSAIQAATAYALAPCDITNKAALVVAVSTYLRTVGSEPEGADTVADERMRKALQSAIDAGGISGQDFASDAWPVSPDFVRVRSNKAPACGVTQRAERRAR